MSSAKVKKIGKDEGKEAHFEDRALKVAMQFFGEVLLPLMGIGDKIEKVLPTEEVTLFMKQSLMDYNFQTTERKIIHFEFQSSNATIEDMRRFRRYEVALADHWQMEVVTFVFYTGNIKHPRTSIAEGVNTYNVIPVIMAEENADEKFAALNRKIKGGEKLGREEIISLLLTPWMSGESSVKERIEETLLLIHKQKKVFISEKELSAMGTVLYVFACKLLEEEELSQIREVIKVTSLGKMLYEDGKRDGVQEGKRKGKREGKREGMFEAIVSILAQWGDIPALVIENIRAQQDLNVLKEWLIIATNSSSITDFQSRI